MHYIHQATEAVALSWAVLISGVLASGVNLSAALIIFILYQITQALARWFCGGR